MEKKNLWGGIFASVAALIGLIGHFVLFFQWYVAGMSAESAEPGCEILLKFLHPGLASAGILAAAFFAVSAYGFFTSKSWALLFSTIGIVLALLASWFINVPFMAAGLPPVYFTLFVPYLLFYFLMLKWVGNISWARVLLALGSGMAYIFCFMNGVSSTSRIVTVGAPLFVLVVGLHWFAMVGWAMFTVGVVIKPKHWLVPLGLLSGMIELFVGFPLAFETGLQLGRFSLFSLAPISCLILVVILVWPKLYPRLTGLEPQA